MTPESSRVWDEVRSDWKNVWSRLADAGRSDHLHWRRTAYSRGEIHWTSSGSPIFGPNLRFRVLRAALGQKEAKALAQRLGRDPGRERSQKRWRWPVHFRPVHAKEIYSTLSLKDDPTNPDSNLRILEEVLEKLAGLSSTRRLSIHDFLWSSLTGPEAPENFLLSLGYVEPGMAVTSFNGHDAKRLTAAAADMNRRAAEYQGGAFIESLLDDAGYDFYIGGAKGSGNATRHDETRRIEEWLTGENRKLVYSVYGNGMRRGLTALACYLWKHCQPGDDRPWCYLPVGRGGPGGAATFRSTVARLWMFYKGENPAEADRLLADTDAASIAESTEERLAFIRKAMSSQEAVIVLDGFQDVGGDEAGDLLRLIRDEPLVALLERTNSPTHRHSERPTCNTSVSANQSSPPRHVAVQQIATLRSSDRTHVVALSKSNG